MGRRSNHTPDELRQLIILAATDLIERDGLQGVSAREIARAIGYSPGTLYNVFDDLADLVVTIELRLLEKLEAHLRAVSQHDDIEHNLRNLALTYLAFSQDKPRLWNLLFEHCVPVGPQIFEPFHQRMQALLSVVTDSVRPLMPNADAEAVELAARVLWASVHGITSLAAIEKPCNVTALNAPQLIEHLIATYVRGLRAASLASETTRA